MKNFYEKLLIIRIREKGLDGDSISEGVIYEMALSIYADLLKETLSTSAEGESGFTFKASRRWFEKLKHRSGIHRVARHREAASSNKEATEKYVGEHSDFANEVGYLPLHVFNWNEIGLLWKRMPNRTYIAKIKSMPGHNIMKDRITIFVCTNSSGDCKIKPMVIYH